MGEVCNFCVAAYLVECWCYLVIYVFLVAANGVAGCNDEVLRGVWFLLVVDATS